MKEHQLNGFGASNSISTGTSHVSGVTHVTNIKAYGTGCKLQEMESMESMDTDTLTVHRRHSDHSTARCPCRVPAADTLPLRAYL